VSLAVGMASIFAALPGMANLMAYWYQFALLFEALFILTTIDTGTRIARYLLQELGGRLYVPLRQFTWWPGVIASSGLVVAAWGYLLGTGSISTIWPMFGAANQLLGTVALCIGTTVLIKMKKARFVWITAVPMLFVGVITLAGSYEMFGMFLKRAGEGGLGSGTLALYFDAALVGIVALLAVIVLVDGARQWYGYLVQGWPLTSSEVIVRCDGRSPDGTRPGISSRTRLTDAGCC
jgi:carbon starvation protein